MFPPWPIICHLTASKSKGHTVRIILYLFTHNLCPVSNIQNKHWICSICMESSLWFVFLFILFIKIGQKLIFYEFFTNQNKTQTSHCDYHQGFKYFLLHHNTCKGVMRVEVPLIIKFWAHILNNQNWAFLFVT